MEEHPFIWARESLESDLRLTLQFRNQSTVSSTKCRKLARNIIAAIRWLNVRILVECNPGKYIAGEDRIEDLLYWYKGERRISR